VPLLEVVDNLDVLHRPFLSVCIFLLPLRDRPSFKIRVGCAHLATKGLLLLTWQDVDLVRSRWVLFSEAAEGILAHVALSNLALDWVIALSQVIDVDVGLLQGVVPCDVNDLL